MSSPALNNLILGGCMLAYISIILMGMNSSLFPSRYVAERIMNFVCPVCAMIEMREILYCLFRFECGFYVSVLH